MTSTTVLPIAGPREVRRALWHEVCCDQRLFGVALALNALAVGAGLVAPWLLGKIVNAVEASVSTAVVSRVDTLAGCVVLATVVQIILMRMAGNSGYRFGERAAARIRERYLRRALELPASIVEKAVTGDLVVRGTTDVVTVTDTLRTAGPDVFVAILQGILVTGAVMLLNPLLGIVALSGLLIVAVALRWYLHRAPSAYLAETAANSDVADLLTTTARGARTIDALGLAQVRGLTADRTLAEARRARLNTLRLRTIFFPSLDLAYVVPLAGVLAVGGVLYDRGAVSIGVVVTAAFYLRQLIAPLETIMLWTDQIQNAFASFARIEGLGAIPSARATRNAQPKNAHIELNDVRYSYDGEVDVLNGIDLSITPGERLAIVGASGAGKSTLGRLLAGIDSPRAGTLTVGGVPLVSLTPEHLRHHVVLVTQEHHVFEETLRDNLLLAQPNARDEDARRALASVGADWVDSLPEGLDTELGEAGRVDLDDGQAQQLSLARVVLADPHTLVLDEATALLDPMTARRTERGLAAVMEGRTVIAIAHRLHTAHDADRIAVMDAGRIVELGSHDELLAAEGIYAGLWHAWQGG